MNAHGDSARETRPDSAAGLTTEAAPGYGPGPGGGESRSVFVDSTGRRSRTFRRFGWAVTVVCACYATTVAASLVGGDSSAPFLRIPGLADRVAEAVEVEGDEAEPAQPSWEPTIPNGTLPSDWGWVEGVVPPSATADPAEAAGRDGGDGGIDVVDAVAPGKTPAGGAGTPAGGQQTEPDTGTDTAPTRPAPGATPPADGSAGGEAGTPPEQPGEETAPPADEPTGNGNPVDGLLGGLLGLPPLLGG